MGDTGLCQRGGGLCRAKRAGGFTLPEVLVSLAVVAILIAILLPSLGAVRMTAQQVFCSSNVRQTGLALSIYTDDYDRALPPSWVWDLGMVTQGSTYTSSDTNVLRVDQLNGRSRETRGRLGYGEEGWDGLGILSSQDYLDPYNVFYCPSHPEHLSPEAFEEAWRSGQGEIRGNYQYRGTGPDGERVLSLVDPASSALVLDTLRIQDDLNHERGINVLLADLSVRWFDAASTGVLDGVPSRLSNVSRSLSGRGVTSGQAVQLVSVDSLRMWAGVDEIAAEVSR
ncbi:MAG: type II secretion system protein [Planctomycetota bacterium]